MLKYGTNPIAAHFAYKEPIRSRLGTVGLTCCDRCENPNERRRQWMGQERERFAFKHRRKRGGSTLSPDRIRAMEPSINKAPMRTNSQQCNCIGPGSLSFFLFYHWVWEWDQRSGVVVPLASRC